MTNEQVIELAEKREPDEDLYFKISLSEVITLYLTIGNPKERVGGCLGFEQVEGIIAIAPLLTSYGGIAEDKSVILQDIELNFMDMVKLFRLETTTEWQVTESLDKTLKWPWQTDLPGRD